MIIDNLFQKLVPQITSYDVSTDGQTLTFLGVKEEKLGVFTRRAAAE